MRNHLVILAKAGIQLIFRHVSRRSGIPAFAGMTGGVGGATCGGVTRPILIFDSGVGGLSVAGAIRALLPAAPLVYAADSAGFPYGTKPPAVIEARVPALLGRLAERYDPQLIVIACNTASTIALDTVRAALDLPIVGTVPAIKPAAELSRTRAIGVLGTQATVVQPYVDNLTAEFAADCRVVRHGSAELVDWPSRSCAGRRWMAAGTLHPRRAARSAGRDAVDTVVLACTHFPLVQPELEAAAPRPLTFVDGKEGIARRVAFLTRGVTWPDRPGEGIAVFTGRDTDLEPLRPALARYGFTRSNGFRPYCESFALAFTAPYPLRAHRGRGTDCFGLSAHLRGRDRSPARGRTLPRLHRHPAQQGRIPQCALLRRP
jgi:glutamate racemase